MSKLILFLLVSSVGQAATISWNAEVLKQIEGARTIKDLTCGAGGIAGQELCDLYKKDQAKKVKFQIERVDDGTIRLKSGSLSVKVEHTDRPLQYRVNDRMIDLNKYPDQERLRFAINAVLSPRHASSFGLISSEAWAQKMESKKQGIKQKKDSPPFDEDPDEVAKAAALQGLVVMDGQFSMCSMVPIENKAQENAAKDPFLKFVETCEADSDTILQYIDSKSSASRAVKDSAVKNQINKKLRDVQTTLAEVDGTIDQKYRNAFACDCRDNKEQPQCKCKEGEDPKKCNPPMTPERFSTGRDIDNMTSPRQKGMDKCQKLLKEIANVPNLLVIGDAEKAKKLRDEIEQKIGAVRSLPPNIAAPAGASK